ncbi:NPCBM/NEW2 domain-containing protein [Deinococcus sp. YIM 134068]|uniref:NPCBM/NEW2 domain-containing protein n=1 Tax=Deinococcus lichenicola TaxID=3118910 RepID=UPI002F92A55A
MRPLPVALVTLMLAACSQPTDPAGSGAAENYDHVDGTWTFPPTLTPQALTVGVNTLYYERALSATSGWGPIEVDRSNGERAAGDGGTLTLNGTAHPRGFGVHASAEQKYALTSTDGSACTRFRAAVGVDDEVGGRGSVVFQVWGDGEKLFDSGRMTGASTTRQIDVDVSGRGTLRMVVTDGGDGKSFDHADWIDPTITCAATPPLVSRTVTVPAGMRAAPFDQTRTLRVPTGSRISVVARVGAARFLLPLPNGDLLVSQPWEGRVVRLQPGTAPSDPKAASVLLSGLKSPHDLVLSTQGGTSYLYVSETDRVRRYPLVGGVPDAGAGQTVVSGLPDASLPELRGSYGHALKNIAIDGGTLYVSIASATNADPADLAATPKRGAVYTYDANRLGQTGTGGTLYAQGLRNAEGLAIAPGARDLWVTVNNRDNLAYPFHGDITGDGQDDYGKVVPSYVDNHPPEELIRVRAGGHYGWPFCNPNPDGGFLNMPFDRDVQTNADGSRLNCGTADRVTVGMPAHAAPLGLTFWTGPGVPAAYAGGAVVGQHGSWNRTSFSGHRFVLFPAVGGSLGEGRDLVTGFVTDPVAKTRWGRPVDAAVAPDGGLYLSDDLSGTVYHLSPPTP